MSHIVDYVQEILTTIEYQSKEYWARKLWPQTYGWMILEIRNIQDENVPNLIKMKELLEEIGDPSFVQPLSRIIRAIDEKDQDKTNAIIRPKLNVTQNQAYGRFAAMPLDYSEPVVKRFPYTKYRQIGNWNDKKDQIMI